MRRGQPPSPTRRNTNIGLGTTLCLGAWIIAGYVYIEQKLNETSIDWYTTASFQKEEEDLMRENATDSGDSIAATKTTTKMATTLGDPLRFCSQSQISTKQQASLKLLYQCKGPACEAFGQTLKTYAAQKSSHYQQQQPPTHNDTTTTTRMQHSASWGHHDFPMPANTTVLLLGNSHLRQVSKTVLCHYYEADDAIMTRIQKLSEDVFAVDFSNGGRWISITNNVLAYSKDFQILWDEEILQAFYPPNNDDETTRPMDNNLMIVMGKFSTYEETKGLGFVAAMKYGKRNFLQSRTQRLQHSNATAAATMKIPLVDFQHIPPPTLLEIAQAYLPRRLVAVPMFRKSDQERAQSEWKDYQEWSEDYYHTPSNSSSKNKNNTHDKSCTTTTTSAYIETREFIDELGQECGSDDRTSIGTCHEDDEGRVSPHRDELPPRLASEMHRCAGKWGGHADLVAWSLVEGLHQGP